MLFWSSGLCNFRVSLFNHKMYCLMHPTWFFLSHNTEFCKQFRDNFCLLPKSIPCRSQEVKLKPGTNIATTQIQNLFWTEVAFLTPGSEIRNRFFPDPGSQTHIFDSLETIFWVKGSINWPKFFSSAFLKYNNFQFFEICGYKKRHDNYFFFTLSFVAVFGSGIRDG